MRTIKGKQNKLESILALCMPDAGLISLINQEHLNIKKNYKSLPIKGGRSHAKNKCRKLRKTQMANENLQISNSLLLKNM